MTEIVKLKELPNDGFETSRVALWLGIGTFWANWGHLKFTLGNFWVSLGLLWSSEGGSG